MKPWAYAVAVATLSASSACLAHQTNNMQAALADLNQAKEHLDRATPDKGGHRVKAMQAIDAAITEVKAAIEYDRTHISPEERERQRR